MKFRNSSLELIAYIKGISHNPVYTFIDQAFLGKIQVKEKKEILISLNVHIGTSKWEIPYSITLCKYLKPECQSNYSEITNKDEKNFSFTKERHITTSLFSIADQININILIDALIILDLNTHSEISNTEYNNIYPEIFLSGADISNLSNSDNLKYCIKKYSGIAKNVEQFYSNPRMWSVPHINLASNKSEAEKNSDIINGETKEVIKAATFNIVPIKYESSYFNSEIDMMKSNRASLIAYRPDTKCVFFGSYAECMAIFDNAESYKSLVINAFKAEQEKYSRAQQEQSNDYNHGGWQRDYFDAMTDGQLGSRDDFNGDIDDIETWAQG